MGVNDANGNLMVNTGYLREGDFTDIYLDVIHELVHVRQFMDGKELFDSCFEYIDRPTEIEAFRHTVEEARRLGLSDDRIFDYLRTEWLSDQDHKKLASRMNVKCSR